MQRRYHMPQRSPLIFWLLLAATLCVDYVVATLQAAHNFTNSGYNVVVLHALILSQLSIACIWSATAPRQTVGTRIAPLIAVLLAAIVTVSFTRIWTENSKSSFIASCLGYYGLHAVLLMASIWLLQRTKLWRKRFGTNRTFQFSLGHILIVMTVTGALTTFMRNNLFFADESKGVSAAFELSFVALPIASVLVWSLSWHWCLRLASVLGFAALLGAGAVIVLDSENPTGPNGFELEAFMIFAAYYLIQAIVLSIWLVWAPIMPPPINAVETQKLEPLVPS